MIKINDIYLGLIIDYETDHHYQGIIIKDGDRLFMYENNDLILLSANQVIEDTLVPLRQYLDKHKKLSVYNNTEVDISEIPFIVNQVKLMLNKQRIRS